MRSKALIALTRFGLGPRPGDVAAIAGDPVAFVRAQLKAPEAAIVRAPSLRGQEEVRTTYIALQKKSRSLRRALREDKTEELRAASEDAAMMRQATVREVMLGEIEARFDHGARTDHPFVERLVLFWSNHLPVERNRGLAMRLLAGLYEREAIRPHVLGHFSHMLAAAVTHPAMLIYLDNARSIGPNSRVGRRRGDVRVNENLAREVLELHTLGAGGGYTQDDVVALAETLSGWTGGFALRERNPTFFRPFHEPGPRTVLGRDYPASGGEQIFQVLEDLAVHPATARHVSGKFARHFVGDDAPQALVDHLTDTFLDTGGDLRALARALVERPEAWEREAAKTVPPYDFMVAAARALRASEMPGRFILRASRDLAHTIWSPPSPAGWPDGDDEFLGGDALLERVDFAKQMARRFARVDDVRRLARDLLGDDIDPFIAEAVDRAEDRRQAMTLLLMSPPFQRR